MRTRFTTLKEWSHAVNRVLHSAHALTITLFQTQQYYLKNIRYTRRMKKVWKSKACLLTRVGIWNIEILYPWTVGIISKKNNFWIVRCCVSAFVGRRFAYPMLMESRTECIGYLLFLSVIFLLSLCSICYITYVYLQVWSSMHVLDVSFREIQLLDWTQNSQSSLSRNHSSRDILSTWVYTISEYLRGLGTRLGTYIVRSSGYSMHALANINITKNGWQCEYEFKFQWNSTRASAMQPFLPLLTNCEPQINLPSSLLCLHWLP